MIAPITRIQPGRITNGSTVKARKRGQRHILLLYQNSMDQIWPASLFFGLLLMAIWFFSNRLLPNLSQFQDTILFISGVVVLAIAAFTLISRKGAYVQAFSDHFRLVTPFLRLKISYHRLTGIRATQFQAVFAPQKMRFYERGSLELFFPNTVVLAALTDYPLGQRTLRLFLPKYVFSPDTTGLVLLVDDWIGLSQDLDHFSLQWRQKQLNIRTRPRSGTGLLGNLPKS